jgi:MFS family permease
LIGRYVFIVVAIAAFGQLIVGYLVDHFSIRVVFVFVAALQAIFLAVMPGLTGWNALFVATAFMFVVFGQIPINDVLISRITQSQWRSRVYAFRYIVTFSVMASSLPIIALIHARWGFDSLFIQGNALVPTGPNWHGVSSNFLREAATHFRRNFTIAKAHVQFLRRYGPRPAWDHRHPGRACR